jgi:phage-related protein
MSSTPISISGINPSEVKSAGWATESTLERLASYSKDSSDAIKGLAKRFNVNVEETKKVSSALNSSSRDTTRAFDALERGNERRSVLMNKSLSDLATGLSRGFDLKIDDPTGPLKPLYAGATSLSRNLTDAGSKLGAYTALLATAISTSMLLITQFGQINDTMRGLLASGIRVSDGFSGLAAGASAAGLSAQQMAEAMTKNALVTVGVGTQRTMRLMSMFATATRNGSEFVMTNQEAQEAFLETMEFMQTAGTLRGSSDEQVVQSSRRYLNELNDLSAATGRSRDEIRRTQRSMSSLPQTYFALNMLPAQAREAFQRTQARVAASFGSQGSQIMDEISKYMTGGIGRMGREFQLLMSPVGQGVGQAMAEIARVAQAGGDTTEAQQEMVTRLHTMDLTRLQSLAQSGSQEHQALLARIVAMRQDTQAEYNRMRARERMSDQERAAADRQLAADRARQEAFNNVTAELAKFGNMLRGAVSELEPILVPALQGLAEIVGYVSSALSGIMTTIRNLGTSLGMSTNTASVVAVATVAVGALIATSVFRRLVSTAIGMVPGAGRGAAGGGGAGNLARAGAGSMRGALGGGALGLLFSGIAAFGDIREANRREREGEISADEARSQRGSALGGMVGGGIGAAIGTFFGGPIGMAIGGFLGNKIGELIGGVIPGVMDSIGNLGRRAWEALTGVGSRIVDFFSGIVDTITSPFRGVGTLITGALGNIGELASMPFRAIGVLITGNIGNIGEIVSAPFRGLGNAILSAIGTIGNIGRAIFGNSGQDVEESGGGIVSALRGVGSRIRSTVEALIPDSQGLRNAVSTIFDGVTGTLRAAGSVIESVIGSISGKISEIITKLTEMRTANIEATTRQITELSSADPSNLNSMASAIDNMTRSLRAFTPGVIEGVSQFVGRILTVDPTTRLRQLTGVAEDMAQTTENVNRFAEALKKVYDMLDSESTARIDRVAMAYLTIGSGMAGMANSPRGREAHARMLEALRESHRADAGTPQIAAGRSSPRISTDELTDKTIQYYDNSIQNLSQMKEALSAANDLNRRAVQMHENSIQRFDQMVVTLSRATELLEQIRTESDDNSSRLVSAIESSSPTVR